MRGRQREEMERVIVGKERERQREERESRDKRKSVAGERVR